MRQLEIDRDLRLNFDRLAIQQIWLVFPLLHGIAGRFGQLSVAAQHLDVRDVSVLRDCRQQFHRAVDMHAKRILRITRRNLLVEQPLRYALRNAHGLKLRFDSAVAGP